MAPKSRSFRTSALPATIFGHLLVVAVTILVLVWLLHFKGGLSLAAGNPVRVINVHTLLMLIGLVLIGGEAIMAYKSNPASKGIQKALHSSLHVVALVAAIVGVYAVFKFKDDLNQKHLTSLHGWFGIITICLFGLQYLMGFFSFLFPRSQMSAREVYIPWHVFCGMVVFYLAVCTAEMGLLERSNVSNLGNSQQGLIVNFTGLLLFLFAVAVGLTVVLPRSYS